MSGSSPGNKANKITLKIVEVTTKNIAFHFNQLMYSIVSACRLLSTYAPTPQMTTGRKEDKRKLERKSMVWISEMG